MLFEWLPHLQTNAISLNMWPTHRLSLLAKVVNFFLLTIRIEQSFEAEATSVFPLLTAMSVISPWMAAKAKNNQQPLHQPGNTNHKL
jgi:hypothetical protein